MSVKNFIVLNTTSGQMSTSGRYTNSQVTNILTQALVINDLITGTNVPGTPTAITGGSLYGKGHMNSTYIKIVTDYSINPTYDSVFIADEFIRFVYLGGSTSSSDTLLYSFATSTTTSSSGLTFNVVFAKSTSQTVGDYFDIQLPDTTAYPILYLVLVVLNGAWDTRTIVSGNTCSINYSGGSILNYNITPSESISDVGKSHYILVSGTNTVYGYVGRISFGVEDALISGTNDYAELKFSISDRMISDVQTNDTNTFVFICYVKGTKILCLVDNIEEYVNIEDIRLGTLVKTLYDGYLPVINIEHDEWINRYGNMMNKIYKMPKENNKDLIEDLYVTGGHSIMVDSLTEEELKETKRIWGEPLMIKGKYRLLSNINKNFSPVNDELRYHTYHICLGKGEENIVYANGILSESQDLEWLRQHRGVIL